VLVRYYETTFILNPQADDATLDQQIKNVAELITASGGRVIREERMGTRRMAYQIDGLTQGHYTSFIFQAPTSTLPVLERHYRLEEPIIRHLTIVFEGDPVAIQEAQKAATAQLFEKEERARAERAEAGGYARPRYNDSRHSESRPPVESRPIEPRPVEPRPVEPTRKEETESDDQL
jgi:small subunit ribosomal protein S6